MENLEVLDESLRYERVCFTVFVYDLSLQWLQNLGVQDSIEMNENVW